MLPEIKKILYATDLSRNSAYAYKYAVSYAEKFDAMITLLHVIEDMGPSARAMVDAFVPPEHHKKVIKESTKRIKKRLSVFCEKVSEESPQCPMRVSSVLVYEGNPVEEILTQAKKLDADLIIMGSHGKGSSSHPFFGSTARKVVGLSRVPVAIIPIPEGETDVTFYDI
ncbi:MAG: Stress response protein NhaX [Deltaproteobacteria bacterium ADurb.Bin072]|nr:MAG: Stress response protein NhaX [Deltaproteobacteria bacterium ADurb.Bin072]